VTPFDRQAIAACALAVAAAGAFAQEKHEWAYAGAHGPQHWGELQADYAACKSGKTQSPIDIRGAVPADLAPIKFDWHSAPLDIVDNGHTVQVTYAPGSSISVGGQRYELAQFHFHEPSEERINGKGYAMVAHFVHKNQEGKLAVVAVLLQEGEDNPLIGEIWKDLPKEKEKEEQLDRIEIDASRILPSNRGYYTFSGSLTTPPCSEDVTWFVLKNPTAVSAQEIERFSQLYRNDARPTQPLYGRFVMETR